MYFLRNCWYVAAQIDELTTGPLGRTILSEDIVLYQTHQGGFAALENACAHRRIPLSLGKVTKHGLQCGYHGMAYDTDGKCVLVPSQDKIPSTACVKSYPVAEKYGYLWIWMGNPAEADPALLPDIADKTFADGWRHVYGYHRIDAYYELLTDNLLDLTHVKFVHESTLGHDGADTAEQKINIDNQQVRSTMFMADQVPAPMFQFLSNTKDKPMDFWTDMLWEAPAYMYLETGVGEVSAPREEGVTLCSTHMLTPETETTTHYFWQVARNKLLDMDGLDDDIYNNVKFAFDEDKAILEAQQQILGPIDIRQSKRMTSLQQDTGASRCRMIIENASLEEKKKATAKTA